MFCVNCGHAAASSARFCSRCGQAVSAHAAEASSPFERGQHAWRSGRPQDALKWFSHTLSISPNDMPTLLSLATLHLQLNEPALAESHLRQAITHSPCDASAYALLGAALLAQYRIDEAHVALDAALQLNPDDPLVRVKRAEYFYRLGQFGDAVGELEHAIQRPSFNFDLQRYANELLRKSREQAKRSFARAPLKFNLQWSRL